MPILQMRGPRLSKFPGAAPAARACLHDGGTQLSPRPVHAPLHPSPPQYGLKKKEEKEAEEKAALEQPCEGSLTRPKKAIPAGCGDEEEEEEESILDTVLKYLPGPLQDMFKK